MWIGWIGSDDARNWLGGTCDRWETAFIAGGLRRVSVLSCVAVATFSASPSTNGVVGRRASRLGVSLYGARFFGESSTLSPGAKNTGLLQEEGRNQGLTGFWSTSRCRETSSGCIPA